MALEEPKEEDFTSSLAISQSHPPHPKSVSQLTEGNSCASMHAHGMASGPDNGHHWKEPSSVRSAPSLEVLDTLL